MSRKDTRIVEMDFDNRNFEKNAQQSISTLDKLKKALNFGNVSNSFNGIETAIKEVNLKPLLNSIDQVKDKFSVLGTFGKRVVENIADSAVSAGKKIWDNTLGQIQSGGSTRALNIANSKFKLEGLGVAWKEASKDINYAVDNTAYSFDAAANTAAQLATAGIKLGDSYGGMAHSLRAVSGIAAMTNASYEEIGYIFSQIASAGRLMGQDAMQISTRGINVTATLAKQLNKTTDEIQEMQRKGEISFDLFAEAMYAAFGDQAVKANETFQGALSNMKSALSRIGEIFYGPFYDAMITPLNKIREAFNKFKALLSDGNDATRDFKDRLTDILNIASNIFSFIVNKVNFDFLDGVIMRLNTTMESVVHVGRMWEKFLGIAKKTDSATDELNNMNKSLKDLSNEEWELAKRVAAGDFGNGEERVRRLKELTDNYELVQEAVSQCAAAGWDWNAVIKNTDEETKNLIVENEKTTDIFRDLAIAFNNALDSAKNIGSVFSTLFGVGIDAFADIFDFKRVSTNIRDFSNLVDDMAENISSYIKNNPKVRENLEVVARIANNVYNAFLNVAKITGIIIEKYVKSFINNIDFNKIRTDIYSLSRAISTFFSDLFNYLNNDDKLDKSFDTFFQGINNIYRILSAVGSIIIELLRSIGVVAVESFDEAGESSNSIVDITDRIATWIEDLQNYIKENDTFVTTIRNLVNFFKDLPDKIGTAIDNINDKFKELTGIDLKQAFSELTDSIGDKFDKLKEKIDEYGSLFEYIKSIVDDIKEKGIIETVKDFFSDLFKSGEGVNEAQTDLDKVLKVVGTIAGIVGAVIGVAKLISNLTRILNNKPKTVQNATDQNAIKSPMDLLRVVNMIKNGITGIINTISKIQTNFDNLITDMRKFTNTLNIVVLAAAVLIFAKAATLFASIKWQDLGKGVLMLGAFYIMTAMMIKKLMMYFSYVDEDMLLDMAKTMAIIVLSMAGSLWVMSKAIQNIARIPDPTVAFGAWGAIELLLFSMLTVVTEISKLNNIEDISKNVAMIFIGMAGGIWIMSKAIITLASLELGKLAQGLISVILLMGSYVGVMLALSKASSYSMNYDTKDILSIAVSMLAFGETIKIMAKGIAKVAELNMDIAQAATTVGSLLSFVAAYTAALVLLEKFNVDVDVILGFAAGVYIFSKSLKSIAKAIELLVALDSETGQMWSAAGALMCIIVIVAAAIGVLAAVNVATAESVVGVALALAAALLSIGGMIFLAAVGFGLGSKLIAQAIDTTANAFEKFSKIDSKGLEKAGKSIALFIGDIAQGIVDATPLLIKVIDVFIKAIVNSIRENLPLIFETIITLIDSYQQNLYSLVGKLFKNIINAIIAALTFLTEKNDEEMSIIEIIGNLLFDALLQIIGVLSSRSNEFSAAFVDWMINLINGIAAAVDARRSEIVSAVTYLLTTVAGLIDDSRKEVENIGKKVIGYFLDGIAAKATDAYNKITEFFNNRIQNVKDVFGIKGDDGTTTVLYKIGKGIISAWIDGVKSMAIDAYDAGDKFFRDFLDGLKAGFADVTGWIASAGADILDLFKGSLKEESPSKATEEDGINLLKGLYNGLRNTEAGEALYNKIKGLGSNMLSGISSGVEEVKNEFSSAFNINDILNMDGLDTDFTISPVWDGSNLDAGLSQFNSDFNSSDYTMGLSTSSSLASSIGTSDFGATPSLSSYGSNADFEALRQDVHYISEKMARIEVRLDTGALVGGLYAGIDEKLGEQQILAGRGVV